MLSVHYYDGTTFFCLLASLRQPSRFQDGGCHESKVQLELKILVGIHPQPAKSESTVAVKILTAFFLSKLINIHDRANPRRFRLYPLMHWTESCLRNRASLSSHSTLFFALERSHLCPVRPVLNTMSSSLSFFFLMLRVFF